MKLTAWLACALAIVAIAGCKARERDSATNAPAKSIEVSPPKGGDWTMVSTPAADGGFVMGNPNAKVKLMEIGSLTCPHCREFDETGVPNLISNYVKSGQVSWEFRNYVRDAADMAAALIARCNGAKSFFPLTRGMYKDQQTWFAKVMAAPQSQMQQLQNLPPEQQFVAIAKLAGLQDWAAARGVPAARANQCLSSQAGINQLVQMGSDTTTEFPDFRGTPSFAINGKFFEIHNGAPVWDQLKAGLDKALGGRA